MSLKVCLGALKKTAAGILTMSMVLSMFLAGGFQMKQAKADSLAAGEYIIDGTTMPSNGGSWGGSKEGPYAGTAFRFVSGGWWRENAGAVSGWNWMHTNNGAANLEFDFVGYYVEFGFGAAWGERTISVSIDDGAPASYVLNSAGNVFVWDGGQGSHTIKLTSPANGGPEAYIDRILFKTEGYNPDPQPIKYRVNGDTFPFPFTSGQWRDVEGPYPYTYFKFISGGWWKEGGAGTGGWGWSWMHSNGGAVDLEFSFYGNSVDLYAVTSAATRLAYASVDGGAQVLLDQSAGVTTSAYSWEGGQGSHTLKITSPAADPYAEVIINEIVYGTDGTEPPYSAFTRYAINGNTWLFPYTGNGWVSGPAPFDTYWRFISGGWWKEGGAGSTGTGFNWMHSNGGDVRVEVDFSGNYLELSFGSNWYARTISVSVDGGVPSVYPVASGGSAVFNWEGFTGDHTLIFTSPPAAERGDIFINELVFGFDPDKDIGAPVFTSDSEISAVAGAVASITVTRDSTALGTDGYYNVTLPEGWTLLTTDLTFIAGGAASKIIQFRVAADDFAAFRNVTIQPVLPEGATRILTTKVNLGVATPPNIVSLISPEYRSDISGVVTLTVAAPGGYTEAYAYYTHAPTDAKPNVHGYTASIGPASLNAAGIGALVIDAADVPNGPVMVKVEAFKADGTSCDGYFQFFNLDGEEWNAGLNGYDANVPGKYDPEIALPALINEIQAGLGKPALQTVFADNFEYSNNDEIKAAISHTGAGKTYGGHYPNYKDDRPGFYGPEYGDTKGDQAYNPYRPVKGDTNSYLLMIDKKHDVPSGAADWGGLSKFMTSPCLSSIGDNGHSAKKLPDYPNWDGWTSGYTEQYLETRVFFGPAPGTWPAFWTLSNGPLDGGGDGSKTGWRGTDELDIVEAWQPTKSFSVNTHTWSYSAYTKSGVSIGGRIGGFSSGNIIAATGTDALVGDFQMGFHTYGCYITKDRTYYFFDGELINSEPTLPLSWRDGSRWMINTGIDATKHQAFPEGYGFTRYGNENYTYVDWVRMWEAPVEAARPLFDVEYDAIELQSVLPGSSLTFKINRQNAAAKNAAVTYDINWPAGWTVTSNGGSTAYGPLTSGYQDTITVSIPVTYLRYSEIIDIIPVIGGVAYDGMYIQTRNNDTSFEIETYPYYVADKEGWDVYAKVSNKSANGTTMAGEITLKSPAGGQWAAAFPALSPGSSYLLPAFEDVPLSVYYTQDFVFELTRDDGFERTINRKLSGLTAAKTADFDFGADGTPFSQSQWDGAMEVKMGGDFYYGGGSWNGDDDLFVTMYTKWSDAYLYVAAVVKDDDHVISNTSQWGNLWDGDSIQFSFDPTRAAGQDSGKNHIRFTGGINNQSKGGLAAETSVNNGANVNQIKINYYRDEANKTTYYLTAFPWRMVLPQGVLSPRVDDINITEDLGFTMLVNDRDGAESRGWIRYMDGIATGKNPNLFGDLLLTNATDLGGYAEEPEEFTLTLIADAGGSVVVGASGDYKAGSVINLSAAADPGYIFDGWIATAGSFGDAISSSTTFNMPAVNVTVTAKFKALEDVEPEEFIISGTTWDFPYTGASWQTGPGPYPNTYFRFISGGWWKEGGAGTTGYGWSWMHSNNGAVNLEFDFVGNYVELNVRSAWNGREVYVAVDGDEPFLVNPGAVANDFLFYWEGSIGQHTLKITSPATPGAEVVINHIRYGTDPSIVVTPPVVLQSIAVTVLPAKTEYTLGDALNLAGLAVTAYYSDGTSGLVTDYATNPANGAALSVAGIRTVEISFTDGAITKTASFTVDVREPAGVATCAAKSYLAKVAKLQNIDYTWNGFGELTFTSSNPAVCNVTQTGTLIPFKAGIAVITCRIDGVSQFIFAVTVSN